MSKNRIDTREYEKINSHAESLANQYMTHFPDERERLLAILVLRKAAAILEKRGETLARKPPQELLRDFVPRIHRMSPPGRTAPAE